MLTSSRPWQQSSISEGARCRLNTSSRRKRTVVGPHTGTSTASRPRILKPPSWRASGTRLSIPANIHVNPGGNNGTTRTRNRRGRSQGTFTSIPAQGSPEGQAEARSQGETEVTNGRRTNPRQRLWLPRRGISAWAEDCARDEDAESCDAAVSEAHDYEAQVIHYTAQQITQIAQAHLSKLADYYSSDKFPAQFDAPIVHAGSLLMVSYLRHKGKTGMVQVPIMAGIFDPHVFEHAISERVEHVFQLMNQEEAA